MLFDTDVLIWVQRGNERAARAIQLSESRQISTQTYLELMQCCKNRQHLRFAKQFIKDYQIQVIPLSENIGHRASVYIEQFSLSHGIRAGDAIIAATAVEHGLILCSANAKHFRMIPDLDYKSFKL